MAFFTLADRDNNRLVWVGVPSLLRSTTDPSIFGVNRLNYQRYKFGKKDGLITEKTRKCWKYATRPRPQPAKKFREFRKVKLHDQLAGVTAQSQQRFQYPQRTTAEVQILLGNS